MLDKEWFTESICDGCATVFFFWIKRSTVWKNIPDIYYDDTDEHVFMYWLVRLFIIDIEKYVNGMYFGPCENMLMGGYYCKHSAICCDIETHKMLCANCSPLSKYSRIELRKEAHERNEKIRIEHEARWKAEEKEDKIFKIMKWQGRLHKSRRRLWTFPWLSLPS